MLNLNGFSKYERNAGVEAAHNRREGGQNWDGEMGWKRPWMSGSSTRVVRRKVYDQGHKRTQRRDQDDLA